MSHIQVQVRLSNTRNIVQGILNREIDLGMVGEWPQDPTEDLELTEYLTDEIVLVAAPSHPTVKIADLTLQRVVDAGLIIREEGSAIRNAATNYLQVQGITPNIALSLGSNQAVKQAALAGGGIGVISSLGVTAEVRAGMLEILNVSGWDCRRPLILVRPKDRYLSPAQRAFLEFLEKERPALANL